MRRILRPGSLPALAVRAARMLVRRGPAEVLRRTRYYLRRSDDRAAYRRWVKERDSLTPEHIDELRVRQAKLAFRPRVSILMPVYNTPAAWLKAAIESVLAQVYPEWELCIADDASPNPSVRAMLDDFAARDARIKVRYRTQTGHIAAATNTALETATGEFISLMDHDDAIPADALFELVAALNDDPSLDLVYSDEDKVDTKGNRYEPAFKPDWSPDYLESCMYTAHLAVYRRAIAQRIGGFRTGLDGAQDYDFVLRFTEQTARIRHVPRILYHWRAIPGSTAAAMEDKSYVVTSGIKALEGRLQRTERSGSVRSNYYAGCFDVRYALARSPLVSIVVPTAGRKRRVRGADVDLVTHCVEALTARSTYRAYEVVIVDNGDLPPDVAEALRRNRCRFITYREPQFNISNKLNLGASVSGGEFLLFLNDDIEVIRPDWIEAMLEQGLKPGVGVVGAKLLYENGTVQHAGVAHNRDGLPDHVRKHFSRHDPGYMFSTVSVKNYLAVTGACMLTPAALFRELGGFDAQYQVNYGDVDYCLRAHQAGHRVVYTPHAELYHFESASRPAEVAQDEIDRFRDKWADVTRRDPYYNNRYLRASPPDFGFDPEP